MKKITIDSLFNQMPGIIGGALLATCLFSVTTKSCEKKKNADRKEPIKTETDTLRIVGVRPGCHSKSLLVTLTDRYGRLSTQECPLYVNWNLANIDPLVTSFERGDTVVMKDGKITENLTQKRLIDEFARQK
ncbi:hypothetical protein HDR63_04030 [bacterium]|nr:hypothetical protein [bacterium]